MCMYVFNNMQYAYVNSNPQTVMHGKLVVKHTYLCVIVFEYMHAQ